MICELQVFYTVEPDVVGTVTTSDRISHRQIETVNTEGVISKVAAENCGVVAFTTDNRIIAFAPSE